MSVCSQMGNGPSKGGNKKKKDHVKEGNHLDDDSPSGPQELENGNLHEEGSKQFLKDRSRRKNAAREILTLRSGGKGESNASSLEGDRNVGDNHASSSESTQGDVRFTVQEVKDLISTSGVSSLANGQVNTNESNGNCEDIVAGEVNSTDPVPVGPGPNPGDHPVAALGTAPAHASGASPVAVSVTAPAHASGSDPVTVPVTAAGTAPFDVALGTSGNGHVNVPHDVHGDISSTVPGNARTETPSNISGVVTQSCLEPNPLFHPSQANPAQLKMPTTANNSSKNTEQTRSRKAQPEEQIDISDTIPDQSIPPTPQSEIESSSPSEMQIVPGIHTKPAENLKVADQLVSKVVTDNTLLLEKLSKYLDKESRVIKCWKHLAYVLDVPPEEREQFDMYTEHSPTEDLFNFLSDIWNPDLTVAELKVKLKNMHRNDVIESLNREGFKDVMKVSDLISGKPMFIKLLSPKLDIESRTIGNWRSLATEFGIRKQKTEQFGLRGSGPTGALFSHMRTAKGLCDLTMEQLQKHFQEMERRDLVNLLSKYEIEGSCLVKKEVVDGSELLAEIGERLNKEIRAVKNWRNLAYRLKIPPEIYNAFDTSKGMAKSPTKMMFEWLARWKPDLNIGNLLKGIKEIDRFDVVEIVTKEAEAALEKGKKDKEDSTQQCYFVDGATRKPTASEVLHDLQQMCQDADKRNSKTTNFLSDLEKNAKDKGFTVSDNPGEGDCMFYALSEQLELVKRIKLSVAELRKELVQYLTEHPKLGNGIDLFNFIHGYPTWSFYLEKMAKPGTEGEHVILVAAANAYQTPIRVVSSLPGHNDIIINPDPSICQGTGNALVLGHVHEEHYVSLRPIQVADDLVFPRGNPQSMQINGQESPYLQSTRYVEPPFSALYVKQQGDLQRRIEQQQQGHYHSQGYQQQQGFQQRHGDQQLYNKRPPWSRDDRTAMKVYKLPAKEVYSKICMKLNIRRDLFFDDFRMVAEELGMDRDTTEYIGQQKNPTDVIFLEHRPNVTAGELVKILHRIKRLDVAAELEKWIDQGST